MSEKEKFFEKAINWAQIRAGENLRAQHEGFDAPVTFSSQSTEKEITPDISYTGKRGGKHYVEIAVKDDNTSRLVTRWKLLSTMADMKNGRLHLLAPRGHKMFTTRLVDLHNLDANVVSI